MEAEVRGQENTTRRLARLMDRRAFLGALGLIAVPGPAGAQPAARKVYRIGVLNAAPASQQPLLERLRELGWIHGRHYVVEYRVYGDAIERIPGLATELIQTGVDIFFLSGSADAVLVRQVTSTIPIVVWGAGDLVAAGVAASLVRPGGNITGIQTLQPELTSKHMSLLKEAIPGLARSGILFHSRGSLAALPPPPHHDREARLARPSSPRPSSDPIWKEIMVAGKAMGIEHLSAIVHRADDLKEAFATFDARRAQAVLIVRNPFMSVHVETIANLALKHRLPTISDLDTLAPQGGLISYGFSTRETMRSAADIVDKILRGGKAAEIPIQQAVRFLLVINLKTAKALGLTIPPSLLQRADQVIE